MKILLLAIVLLSCNTQSSKGESFQKVCLIKQNGVLIEKRYLDAKSAITSIVTYGEDGKTPVDSISFNCHSEITAYSFDMGHYSLNDLSLVRNYYSQVYDIDSTCNLFNVILHRFLIEDVISNLCSIQNSVLADGTEVSTKAVITKGTKGVTIKYPKLNSIFKNLPEVLQSYFYNQPLESFSLLVEDGYLQQETYFFPGGSILRNFIYKGGLLRKSTLEIRYSNDMYAPLKLIRTYELK